MKTERFEAGGTIGGKWGCALSAIVGLPLLGGALAVASMGHCAPDADCIPNWQLFAGAAAITAFVGVASRAAINAIAKRWR